MSFNIREITQEDLPEIFRWFENRSWPLPPVEGVGAKLGMLAEKNGIIYACIYTYMTGTSVAYLEWPGTNPDVPQHQSMGAFDEIVFHFKKMCELSEPKIRVLSITTQSKPLSDRFKKMGFKTNGGFYKSIWTLKES